MKRQLENTVRRANFLLPTKKTTARGKRIKEKVHQMEPFPKPRDSLFYSKMPSETDSVVKYLLDAAKHSEVTLDPVNRNM